MRKFKLNKDGYSLGFQVMKARRFGRFETSLESQSFRYDSVIISIDKGASLGLG